MNKTLKLSGKMMNIDISKKTNDRIFEAYSRDRSISRERLFELLEGRTVKFESPFWLRLESFTLTQDGSELHIYGCGSSESKFIGTVLNED